MREHEEIKKILKNFWEKNPRLKVYPYEEWERAYDKGKLIFTTWRNFEFFRINKEFKNLPVGTFFNENFFIKGYPSIPRIYVLKTGLNRYLEYPFFAEEKIEGYNIRLLKIGKEILAFTRRGYICPFATDRWEDFLPILPEFFERYPNYYLCCELAGPENPFVSEWPPYIKEDINFFVFDIVDRNTGKFLNISHKIKLLEEFQLNHPEILGPFDPEKDYEKIRKLVVRYHIEKREGLVFKSDSGTSRVKYVTPYSNLMDLKIVFPYLGEVEPNYISLRLIRLLTNLYEFEEFKDEVYKELGRYLFEDALNLIKSRKICEETFKVRFKREENFLALLAHFKLARVNIEILEKYWKNNYLFVKFKKIYPKATQFWNHKLEGWGEVD
ncbi:MAG: RNA ligase [Caldimicrobium sp.]